MTVNKNPFPFLVKALQDLADHECLLNLGAREVLPEKVEVGDTCVIEYLTIVREANFVIDTVATKGMFSRLLQIHDAPYIKTETE